MYHKYKVLILVLMEYALLHYILAFRIALRKAVLILVLMEYALLHWVHRNFPKSKLLKVLILVLMEYALLQVCGRLYHTNFEVVLILVLMEYALLQNKD